MGLKMSCATEINKEGSRMLCAAFPVILVSFKGGNKYGYPQIVVGQWTFLAAVEYKLL
jgi:hypothetical protein